RRSESSPGWRISVSWPDPGSPLLEPPPSIPLESRPFQAGRDALPMNIAVIGTGYVGLVSGACFAEMGNNVTCVDRDADKVARMQRGECPIYEIGLPELLQSNIAAGRLRFSTSLDDVAGRCDIFFIAV